MQAGIIVMMYTASVPLATEYDGLRFIFDYYRLKLNPKDFEDSSIAIVTKYKNHYDTVSKEMGYKDCTT
jgi:hypothetical protein